MGNLNIEQLAVDLVINIINILVLFLIVKVLVYKPVKKFLAARSQRVAEQQTQAEEALSKAKIAEEQRDKTIEEGRRKAQELADEAVLEAKKRSAGIIADAERKADEMLAKARREIEEEHNGMLSSMQGEIAGLAIDISQQILRREVNEDDSRRIVNEFFSGSNAAEAEKQ